MIGIAVSIVFWVVLSVAVTSKTPSDIGAGRRAPNITNKAAVVPDEGAITSSDLSGPGCPDELDGSKEDHYEEAE